MVAYIRKSVGRKLLVAVGLPSLALTFGGILWLKYATRALAPGLDEIYHLALGAAVVLALALSATHFLAVRILVENPIQRLTAGMRRAQEGDFLTRVPIEADDELGELARSFNSALAAVTDLHARRIDDARSLESMQRELALKAELEEQHRLLDQTNRTLEASLQELTLLFDLTRTLNSTLELDELLRVTSEKIERSLGFDAFALLLVDEATGDLVVKTTFGVYAGLAGARLPAGDGFAGWVAREKQLLLVRDTRTDHRPDERWLGDSHGSVLVVPMLCQDECVGVLDVFRPRPDAFGEDEVRLLQSAASQAAMAIANARLHARTVRLSLTDPLTGMHNRRSLFAQLEMELERSERFEQPMAMAMIDVDHFRGYNDGFGHLAGDAVLKRVSALLASSIRKVDTLARYGGEEFALILPRNDGAAAAQAAEKLRALIAATPFPYGEHQPGDRITVSIGIAAYPEDARELATLVDCADAALYAAKRAGRNAVVTYAAGMREHPGRRRDVRVTAQVEPGGG